MEFTRQRGISDRDLADLQTLRSPPRCGKQATREVDTMDILGFLVVFSDTCDSGRTVYAPFDSDKANYWMNVDQYIGGVGTR